MTPRNPRGRRFTVVQRYGPKLVKVAELMRPGEVVQFEYICRVLLGATPSQQATFAREMKDKSSKLCAAMQRRGVTYKVLHWSYENGFQQSQSALMKAAP